jgi:hypothetical protein
MMKKLLVLVLVLALFSAANAAMTLNIVDNGTGTCGINSAGYAGFADEMYYAVVSLAPATTGGVVTALAPTASSVQNDAWGAGAMDLILPAGENGVWGYLGTANPLAPPQAGGVYIDLIQSRVGDTVKLYHVADDWSGVTLLDTATLIPEPMTLVLLGLGGLFLRRRK